MYGTRDLTGARTRAPADPLGQFLMKLVTVLVQARLQGPLCRPLPQFPSSSHTLCLRQPCGNGITLVFLQPLLSLCHSVTLSLCLPSFLPSFLPHFLPPQASTHCSIPAHKSTIRSFTGIPKAGDI